MTRDTIHQGENMKIFIPRLPSHTSQKDLWNFVNAGMGSRFRLPFLVKQSQICSCEILWIKDRQGVAEHHGLVNITPETEAIKVIRRLNGKPINGKPVIVRRYFERGQKRSSTVTDDRRRTSLEIIKLKQSTVRTMGYDMLSREHG